MTILRNILHWAADKESTDGGECGVEQRCDSDDEDEVPGHILY